jgi:formate dehydrogenase subunit gamma
MPETTFAEEAELQRLIAAHRDQPGALLPILHAVQEAFGYVDDAAVPIIAKALNLSRAEVHGVLTFYHDFRREPAGRHVLRLCQAEACQSMGCEKLAEGLRARLGIDFGGTTPDGRLTLETVYCLGNCALSPAGMLDGRLYGRLDARRLDALLVATERL